MTLGPVLLRVLLSFSLVLNGSGYAMAASHVERGQGAVVAASARTHAEQVTGAPCHHSEDAGAPEKSTQLSDTTLGGSATGTGEESDDCCKNGGCRCDCLHQTQVAVPVFFLDSPVRASPPLRGQQNRHAEPAPPHLTRPPIV